jgi:hypothetical protein
MKLNSDLREFIALLNSNSVEYLVVGAFAVAFHGYTRLTGDLDILMRPTPENANRILRAIAEFGFESLRITLDDLQTPGFVVQLGFSPNRIDIITTLSGVGFDEAWAGRCEANIDGIPTRYIGRSELIRNKEATGRARDLGDVDEAFSAQNVPQNLLDRSHSRQTVSKRQLSGAFTNIGAISL